MGSSKSFAHTLTILFVALKLTGYIDWSWFKVLSPIFIIYSVILILAIIITIGDAITDKESDKKINKKFDDYIKSISRNN